MTIPQKVAFYKNCIPQKGVWYDLHGDIFISVMLESKPHVRRKAVPNDNKRDNDLSEWHRVWQYDIIENRYGIEATGIKSYERTITVDEEIHRIDSLVNNTAIEFQHTLSVDLSEMDNRYKAHNEFGYIPYLVLDLTSFTFSDFVACFNKPEKSPLNTKLDKWLKSSYSVNNRLFLDLESNMVRIVHTLRSGFQYLPKVEFIESIPQLEDQLLVIVDEDKKQQRVIAEEEKRKRLIAEQKAAEKERYRFTQEKFDNPDYKFFRFCFGHPQIKPHVSKYDGEVFEYFSDSDIIDGFKEKYHTYSSKDSDFRIVYKTVSKIIEKEIHGYRGFRVQKDYKYEYAIISLKMRYKTIAKFKRQENSVTAIPFHEYD